MLAVPSRCAARLPHLSKHDVAEIDAEIKQALGELGVANSRVSWNFKPVRNLR
jgi:phage terminase Nu1 subunit (DNA packaging protein)